MITLLCEVELPTTLVNLKLRYRLSNWGNLRLDQVLLGCLGIGGHGSHETERTSLLRYRAGGSRKVVADDRRVFLILSVHKSGLREADCRHVSWFPLFKLNRGRLLLLLLSLLLQQLLLTLREELFKLVL